MKTHLTIKKKAWDLPAYSGEKGSVRVTAHFAGHGVNHCDVIDLKKEDLHISHEFCFPQIEVTNTGHGTLEGAPIGRFYGVFGNPLGTGGLTVRVCCPITNHSHINLYFSERNTQPGFKVDSVVKEFSTISTAGEMV